MLNDRNNERLSREVRTIRTQADIVARSTHRTTSSVHYLVAMFVVECQAREVLAETKVNDQTVLDTFQRMPERDDPPEALQEIHRHSARLAESAGLPETTSMVLLASLLRVRESLACRVLERAGVNVPGLRSKVIGMVTFENDRTATGQRPAYRPGETNKHPVVPGQRTSSSAIPLPLPVLTPPVLTPPVLTPPVLTSPMLTLPVLTPPVQPTPTQSVAAHRPTPPPQPAKPAAPQQLSLPTGVFALPADQFPALHECGRNLTAQALLGKIDPVVGRDSIIESVIDILLMKHANNPCLIGEAGVGKTAIAEGLAARLAGNVAQYGKLGTAVVIEIQVSALVAGTGLRGAFSEKMRKLRDEVARADGQVIVFMDEVHTIMGAGTGDGPLDAANDLKSALSRGKFPLIGATTRAEYKRHIETDPAMDRRFQVVDVPEPSVPEALLIMAGVAPTYGRHHGVTYSHDALASAVHLSRRFITDRCLPDKAIAVIDRAGAQAKRAGRPQVQVDDVARAVHVLTGVPMERLLADERGRIRDLAADLQTKIVGHDSAMARIAKRIQRNYAGFSGDRPVASLLFAGAPGVGKTETARALAELLFVSGDALVRFDMSEYAEPSSLSRLLGSPPGYVGHQQAGLLAQAMQKRPYRVLLFDEVDKSAQEVRAVLLQLLDGGRVTDNHGHTVDIRNCIVVLTTNVGADALATSRRRAIGFGALEAMPLTERMQPDEATQLGQDSAALEAAQQALSAELWRRIDEAIVFRPLDLQAARQIARREIDAGAKRLYEARLIHYEVEESVVDLVLEDGLDPSTGVRPLRSRIERIVEAFVTDCILDGLLRPGASVLIAARQGQLVVLPNFVAVEAASGAAAA